MRKQLNDENNKDFSILQSCSLFVQCKKTDRSQWSYSIELNKEKEGRAVQETLW